MEVHVLCSMSTTWYIDKHTPLSIHHSSIRLFFEKRLIIELLTGLLCYLSLSLLDTLNLQVVHALLKRYRISIHIRDFLWIYIAFKKKNLFYTHTNTYLSYSKAASRHSKSPLPLYYVLKIHFNTHILLPLLKCIPFCQSYIVSNIQDLNCLATFLVCEVESNNQEVLRIVHKVQLQACLHNNITLHHRRAAYLGLYISGKEEKRMHWMLCVCGYNFK